ncbi:MAG: ribonuclease III [Firmicutes bacterium]|nr:ribonuclease III [Bacillota bacterium]MBQ1959313.1 ribonuclease III [Bacillota bacterium]
MEELENIIGYSFIHPEILERALTHSSYNREKNTKHMDNERLEFIGDGFLDAIVGFELFNRMKGVTEGRLTKTRALIVCEKALADVAREIGLGRFMYMGHGEEAGGGRGKDSILADCMEAVIGGIFLDGGYEAASRFVVRFLKETIDKAIDGKIFLDYKSEVQEILQSKGKTVNIVYITDREEGPAHNKTFFVHMECDGKVYGSGSGKSKKEAEQNAAKESVATLRRGEK